MLHGEAGYVVAAYTVAAILVAAIATAILMDYRAQRRALGRLEKLTGVDEDQS